MGVGWGWGLLDTFINIATLRYFLCIDHGAENVVFSRFWYHISTLHLLFLWQSLSEDSECRQHTKLKTDLIEDTTYSAWYDQKHHLYSSQLNRVASLTRWHWSHVLCSIPLQLPCDIWIKSASNKQRQNTPTCELCHLVTPYGVRCHACGHGALLSAQNRPLWRCNIVFSSLSIDRQYQNRPRAIHR